jgi:MSHA biogenesis protein MshQ
MGLWGASSVSAATCSAYRGQAFINEVRIGSTTNSSTSNQVEVFNSANLASTVWRTWKIQIYYRSSATGTPAIYNYPLSAFSNAGQFIYNTSAMFLRNRSQTGRGLDIALLDSAGNFIDYIALDRVVQVVPTCTPATVVLPSSTSRQVGDLARIPDAGAWPSRVIQTSTHTIGSSNVCSAGVSDLSVSQSVDVTIPIINTTTVTYTVTVTNKSCTNTVNGVTISTSNLVATNFSGLTRSVTTGSVTTSGSNLVWTVGNMVKGTSQILTFTGIPINLGALTSTAAVSAPTTGLSNLTDDSSAVTINVRDFNYVGFDLSADTLTEGTTTLYSANMTSSIVASSPITINYTITGSATAADTSLGSLPKSGSVIIDPTDPETPDSVSIDFTVLDDSISELTKNLTLTITSVTSADPAVKKDPAAATMALTLEDDDQVICVTDNFSTGTLNPALWNALNFLGPFTPAVVDVGGQKRLRVTSAVGNEATMVQLKKWYPGGVNKIIVEFDYYVYGGNGADGLTVVFSDADVAPAAGGYGGSLGYAQRSGTNGFNGGWLGVGIDEFGNFPGTGEGRTGYPAGWTPPAGANVPAGAYNNSVAVRGSGSAQTGYPLLANTGTLSPVIWSGTSTSATLQKFRITIDHSNGTNAWVSVERNVGGGYLSLIPAFDAKAYAGQAPVPANWLVSFTGSTGGSYNIHELANLSICATSVQDPPGSNNASAFECLQAGTNNPWSVSARKPLYTQKAATAFKLDVAALKADGSLESNYVSAGGNSRYVKLELFDDGTPPASCAAYSSPVVTQTVTFASGVFSGTAGRTASGNITINNAYKKLRCRIAECTDSTCGTLTATAAACSSDQFSVRPSVATLATSATAGAPSSSGTPAVKAGSSFTLRATTATANSSYNGTLALDGSKLAAQTTAQETSQQSGGIVGALSPGSLVGNAGAVNATYSEVGYVYLAPGAYRDDTWTVVDSAVGDCVTSTTADANLSDVLVGGKYGCSIGNQTAVSLGRFYPDHFAVTSPVFAAGCGGFTYMGQPFNLSATVQAQNLANQRTQNFAGVFAKATVTPEMENADSGSALSASRLTGLGSPVWTLGEYPFVATGFSKLASADGPYDSLDIGLTLTPTALVDAAYLVNRNMAEVATACTPDASGTSNGSCTAVKIATNAKMRFGRLRMQNAYGSELLALPVPLESQYWTGNYFAINSLDSCTVLPMNSITLGSYTGGLAACETQITPTGSVSFVAGKLPGTGLVLTKPGSGNGGNVNLALNAGAAATGNTCVSATETAAGAANLPWFGPNLGARATFGIYKSPLIYRRENY